MSLRDGIAQLRTTLDRYAGVEATLQEIEADVVLACRQIVDAAGAKPPRGHYDNIPIVETGTRSVVDAPSSDDAPGGTEARKRGPMGADTPSPARRVATKTKRTYTTGKKKWTVPPPRPKAARDDSPAPESTHTAAIAQIEARLGRPLTVKESTAAEVLLDGGSVRDVAATLGIGYGGAWYYAQKLGIDAPQSTKPAKAKAKKTVAEDDPDDDDPDDDA